MRKRNEGNEEQRQAASRQASRGEASECRTAFDRLVKQERHAKGSAGYREKLEPRDKGRQPPKQHGSKPKPGRQG